MAAESPKRLHIAMFPWLAFGHIIPFLDLSRFIAQKGHKISFISTPRNIDRLPKPPPNSPPISLVKIPLPKLAELPEAAEATMDITADQTDHLKRAFDGLEPGLTRFLEDSEPDWIIYDFAPHWLPPVAARLGISRAFFNIVNAWFLAFFGPVGPLISGSGDRAEPEDFMVPPEWVKFETRVAYRRFEAKWMVGAGRKDGSGFSDFYRQGKAIAGSEAILSRHCCEFEPEWLAVLEEIHRSKVVPLGLMPRVTQDADEDDEIWVSIRKWLNGQGARSVVYVALGSEVTPSQGQLSELARGLELSGVPFFWVLRNSGELPGGFEERASGRGMVWKSWAPQVKILRHDSVGGFLTHCGWSSIVEGLTCGLPMIALPFLVDQGLNCRVIVEKELGIEIPRNEEDGSYTSDSVADSVKVVMLGNDGRKFREKAKEMGVIFGDAEVHSKYIDEFVEFLRSHRAMSTTSIT